MRQISFRPFATLLLLIAIGGRGATGEQPDPTQLLNEVRDARISIASGRVAMNVERTPSEPPKHGTDHSTLSIVFDGQNRRCEATTRELVIDSVVDGGQARQEKLEQLQGDREEFVRLGLGQWQDRYRCSAFDGQSLIQYSDGSGTTISDPSRGSIYFAFDPRILGIGTFLSVTMTVERCLTPGDNETLSLVGPDKIGSQDAWHINFVQDGNELHFWIAEKNTTRVLRHERVGQNGVRRSVMVSTYDENNPTGAFPQSVTLEDFQGGELRWRWKFNVMDSQFNIPTDPTSWTLAGVNMPVGTAVSDIRIHQRLGYWDGQGLSEQALIRADRELVPIAPLHQGKLLKLAESDPDSALALDAASWIVANVPDGSDRSKAADILIQNHITDARLAALCERLRDSESATSQRVLSAVLEKNPHHEAQAWAAYAVAMNASRRARSDTIDVQKRASLVNEAAQLFKRLQSESADIQHPRGTLAEIAESELNELLNLGIGDSAPDIAGVDSENRTFRLSDNRGKVIVLTFSSSSCSACVAMYPQLREMIKEWHTDSFVVLSVNGDEDNERLDKSIAGGDVTWRCWCDVTGEIADSWNVTYWPRVYVIDKLGVIRHKDLRGAELERAVAALLEE